MFDRSQWLANDEPVETPPPAGQAGQHNSALDFNQARLDATLGRKRMNRRIGGKGGLKLMLIPLVLAVLAAVVLALAPSDVSGIFPSLVSKLGGHADAGISTTPSPVPSITPIPVLDLTKPTVECNDGALRKVAYQQGACTFRGGIKKVLQPIPLLPSKP